MGIRLVYAAAVSVALATAAHAQSGGLNKAKNTVDNIRQPDPPQVSTGTVVQPIPKPPQQMPRGGSDLKVKPPPPPPPK
jgi:hypothetical protein